MRRETTPPPAGADLRGFQYPLEAMMRREQWQLDRLRAEWARAQRATREARQGLARLDARHSQAREAIALRWTNRPDAGLHSASIVYLARLQTEIKNQREQIDSLAQRQTQARTHYLDQRQRLSAIERHREDALGEFAREQLRRASVEADREWLSRKAANAGGRA